MARIRIQSLLAAIAAASFGQTASASPQDLCPAGWTCEKEKRGKGYTFTARGGEDFGKAQVNLFPKDSPAEVKKLLEMKLRHIKPYRSDPVGEPKNTQQLGANMTVIVRRDRDNRRKLFATGAVAKPHKLGGTVTCAIAVPLGPNGSPPRSFSDFLANCAASLRESHSTHSRQARRLSARKSASCLR